MTIARLRAAGIEGVEAHPVEVEVDVAGGLPSVIVVGLPDAAVRESRDRVRAAIKNSGFSFPQSRITVNLAPARRRKDGAAFDLSIALGLLAAGDVFPRERLRGVAALGELSLEGRARPVRGALAAAEALRKAGTRKLLIARGSAREAALAGERLRVIPVDDLGQAVAILKADRPMSEVQVDPRAELAQGSSSEGEDALDLRDVHGCYAAKRALLIAAAGGHDMLMVGPPGCGKTMLARRLIGLLPPLELDEALEVTRIQGIVGASSGGLVTRRPLRAPHHTSSYVGLVGGGTTGVRVGEVTLAHHGVLFLDELPEFPSRALEALREPLETHQIAVGRAWGRLELPADFQLVAAMNPCPCGFLNDPRRECRCTDALRLRYATRVSGPLLDRIDLQVAMRPIEPETLVDGLGPDVESLSTLEARKLVIRAREFQRERQGRRASFVLNSRLRARDLERHGQLEAAARDLLRSAAGRLSLSARGIVKTKRIGRTIADLEQRATVSPEDISEALLLRRIEDARLEPMIGAAGR